MLRISRTLLNSSMVSEAIKEYNIGKFNIFYSALDRKEKEECIELINLTEDTVNNEIPLTSVDIALAPIVPFAGIMQGIAYDIYVYHNTEIIDNAVFIP